MIVRAKSRNNHSFSTSVVAAVDRRVKRSVWTIANRGIKGSHFATFPPDLIRPMILSSSAKGDIVLDPFGGSGTVGIVAKQHGRLPVLCEFKPEYIQIAQSRMAAVVESWCAATENKKGNRTSSQSG